MTYPNPIIEKCFLALRTSMYQDGELFEPCKDEHVTLQYYQSIHWEYLLLDAAWYSQNLPSHVIVKDYGTWSTDTERFVGARLRSSGILRNKTFPHITLSKIPLRWGREEYEILNVPEKALSQSVNKVWFGKKINGEIQWIDATGNNFQIRQLLDLSN